MDELGILYREIELSPDSHILDMGCGAGYLSAEIANHYSSHLTGIDFDEGSIIHARKVFLNNPKLNFIHGDGILASFEASAFDLICFLDSLHFTRTDEKLYELLDKCLNMLKPAGKLAILHGRDNQQIVKWGQNNFITVKTVDLIESNKKLWRNVFNELITMASELQTEVPDTYERIKTECIEKLNNNGWGSRWLYIFEKQ